MTPLDYAVSRLSLHKHSFQSEFDKFFQDLPSRLDLPTSSRWSKDTLTLLQDFSLGGGKRQRVAFMYESLGLVKSKHNPNPSLARDSLLVAISIELLQTHLLIHDDIIDDSDMRRGQPTFHVSLSKIMSNDQSRSVALLAGDVASYLSIWALSACNPEFYQKLVIAQLGAGVDTFWGQIFDLERDCSEEFTKTQALELADYKAVRSSTFTPMMLGLILASADTSQNIARVREYSYAAGIVGQLQDDYLSIFGDSNITGKSVLADLKEGKRTLIVAHALARCSSIENKKLNSILGSKDVTLSDARWCKNLFVKYGSDVAIREEAASWAKKAKQCAASWTDWDNDAVRFFVGVADWFLERKL